MEKQVMVRLCAKIITETNFYEADNEVKGLIDWIIASNRIKENNNKIRTLIADYRKLENKCREGLEEAVIQREAICEERQRLYDEQQEFKHQMLIAEKAFKR